MGAHQIRGGARERHVPPVCGDRREAAARPVGLGASAPDADEPQRMRRPVEREDVVPSIVTVADQVGG